MKLSDKQIAVLQKINEKLERGDVTEIAKRSGFTYEHTWRVLNPFVGSYNDKVIEAAINLVLEREELRAAHADRILA